MQSGVPRVESNASLNLNNQTHESAPVRIRRAADRASIDGDEFQPARRQPNNTVNHQDRHGRPALDQEETKVQMAINDVDSANDLNEADDHMDYLFDELE